MKDRKYTHSLMYHFTLVFSIFAIIVLVVGGIATYLSQQLIYKRQCQERAQSVGVYLADLMAGEGEDIITYRDYYMENYKNLDIPIDFTSYEDAWSDYERIMSTEYPGKVLGEDIELSDLSDEEKKAYFTYTHEYWLLTFEKAREAFDLPYTYFLVMIEDQKTIDEKGYDISFVEGEGKEERDNVCYMIDGERTAREDDESLMYLGDSYYNPREDYEVMWKTYDTGERQNGYMEWDNSWGHTYGYYTPLIIDGEKVGLVVTEVNYKTVNREILRNTLRQLCVVFVVFIFGLIIMLIITREAFVKRARILGDEILDYSKTRDPKKADELLSLFDGKDEISILAERFSTMIRDLTKYIGDLKKTSKELKDKSSELIKTSNELIDTKQQAEEMAELANKDALTGVLNSMAYMRETERLNDLIKTRKINFAVVMIDLNFLKQINDTYGHDKGDIAITTISGVIESTFINSPVFRIGGDEFAVILENSAYRNRNILVGRFEERIEKLSEDEKKEPWNRPSAALGISIFKPEKDASFDEVFKRADEAMYERKEEMKAAKAP